MVFNEKQVKIIGEKVAEKLNTDIKCISSLNYNRGKKISFNDNSKLSIKTDEDLIKEIFYWNNMNSMYSMNCKVKFHQYWLIKKQYPFYLITDCNDNTDSDLFCHNYTKISLFPNSYYTYSAKINGEYDSVISAESHAKMLALMNVKTLWKDNYCKAYYYEQFRTSGILVSNEDVDKTSIVICHQSDIYLKKLVSYIESLKKKYKYRECEIDDIINILLLQKQLDSCLNHNFLELVEINGAKEKMLKLKRNK